VRTELDYLASRRPPTAWTRALVDGRSGAMRRLGQAVRAYHETALAPYWRSIRRHVVADRARRAEQLASQGIDQVLSNLHPRVRWERSVLTALDFSDADVYLNGRGLLLQPSFFCWQAPTKLRDNSLPPVLVYPTQPPPGALYKPGPNEPEPGTSPLAALIGRTRALALELTVVGRTTSELARLCGISVAAASQQATVLRDAGLITTRRDGSAVRHEITALGISMLNGTGLAPATAVAAPGSETPV
jgi:DNA-binding transcriptional ArsR family regulator